MSRKQTSTGPEADANHARRKVPHDAGRARSSRRGMWAFAAAIVLAGLVGYWGGLDNGFTNWDDNWLITDNRHIRGVTWENVQAMFNPMAPREELGNEYLPLRDLSYAINYQLDGLNPRGYHATNLLLHLLNGLLVMLLAWRVTGRRWIGGLAGLLFTVHPVQVEAVSWLSSRKDLLATLFLLLSVNLYLSARSRASAPTASGDSLARRVRESARLSYGLAVLLFVCALLSKMTTVVLPALLLLLELFRGRALKPASPLRRGLMLAPFWLIAGLFTMLAGHIGRGLMREPYGDGRWQSFLTAISAITRDFQVLVTGRPLYAAVDLPIQTGLSLSVVIGLVLAAGLVALGLTGWRISTREDGDKRRALLLGAAGFGSLWFLAALSPVSNLLVQIGTVFAERYLYLPSIGFFIVAAAVAVLGFEKLQATERLRPVLPWAAGLLLVVVTGLATWQTSRMTGVWRNSLTLWRHTLKHDPGNHVAHFNLGREYEERAMAEPDPRRRREFLESAYEQYEKALVHPARTYRFDPARVYGAKALNLVHRGFHEDALAALDAAHENIDLPWRNAEARADIEALLANPRGLALSALGRHDEALAAFEEALAKSSRYTSARVNIATELGRRAFAPDAIDEATLNRAWAELATYERAKGRDAIFVEARARLKLAEFDRRLALSGRGGEAEVPGELKPLLEEARGLYRELIDLRERGLWPPTAMAGTLLEAADAFARGRAGDAEAERLLRRALRVSPDYVGVRTLLAQLLFERDDSPSRAEATRLLNEELRLFPDHRPARALRAAGLRQAFVNEIEKLRLNWRERFRQETGDDDPTWPGLIRRFFRDQDFGTSLLTAVTLLRQAVEHDPDHDEGHNLIEGTGVDIAIGMWLTRRPEMRAGAETMLREAFNARPIDGLISDVLTTFYIELAEQVIAAPERDEAEARGKRSDLETLLENMLALSDRARRILSNRLYRVGREVEDNRRGLRGEDELPLELSAAARREAAAEFIRAATLLNPENIEALDWLKTYYEEEGNLDEALNIFTRLVDALGERPELLHGVHLSLGQLQLNLGQELVRRFQRSLRDGKEPEAAAARERAIQTFHDVLKTTDILLNNPEHPDQLTHPIRMRGVAGQRLAYLVAREAERYYTIALDAYERQPLDFPEEMTEVRRKRAWFVQDPYRRLRELTHVLNNAPADHDTTFIRQDIRNLEQRIAQIEAEAYLRDNRPDRAMERLHKAFRAPTPEMYAVRARIHEAKARLATSDADRDEHLVAAARDYVRAAFDAEALHTGAELFWSNEALRFEEDAPVRARVAWMQAEELLNVSLAGMELDDPSRRSLERLREVIRGRLTDIHRLAQRYEVGARASFEKGELDQAASFARRAIDLTGDNPWTLQLLGQIQRARAALGGPDALGHAEAARVSFLSALRLDNILSSQRAALHIELIELLIHELDDKEQARNWIDIAERSLQTASGPVADDLRAEYLPRLRELMRLARPSGAHRTD